MEERALAAAATALVTDPALLIADEPLAGLDETRAVGLAAQIASLQATRVLVTHELEPLSFATHTIHLGNGRVVPRPAAVRVEALSEPSAPVGSGSANSAVVLQLFAASSADRPNVPPVSITMHAGS